MSHKNLVRDALYYTSPNSCSSPDKAQGVVIGVVSMLMADRNLTFDEAIHVVKTNLPDDYSIDAIPYSWRESFR